MVLPTSSVLVDRVLAKSAANAINAIQIKSHSARNNVIEAENYQHIGREHGWYQGVERRKRLFTFTILHTCTTVLFSFVQSTIWKKMLMRLKDVFMIYALIYKCYSDRVWSYVQLQVRVCRIYPAICSFPPALCARVRSKSYINWRIALGPI